MANILKGRLKKAAVKALDYTESIEIDNVLAPYDIQGSIAHLLMLSKCKIIKPAEKTKILKALKEIEREIKQGRFKFKKELEDVHLNIEARLIEKAGEAGKKLHTARSRNDQIALDLRLYLREEIKEILFFLKNLEKVLVRKAEQNFNVLMPGFTHLQPAQPILYSHYLMAHFHAFQRDYERLVKVSEVINELPLGACALAGTSFPIDRKFAAKLLGFKKVIPNSMDAVSNRDFAIDFIFAGSMVMLHLSRLMDEIIIWSTPFFGFIEISDEFCTTSSIMPQKKNPDVAELIRAKTSRAYGNLLSFLSLMKGLPLTYNRDLQEGNTLVIDTVSILKKSLDVAGELIKDIKVNKGNMEDALKKGFLEATEVADYLTRKGVAFRKAHQIVACIVRDLEKREKDISQLSLTELKRYSPYFSSDVKKVLNPQAIVKDKKSEGGTSQTEVRKDIKKAKGRLNARL